MVAVPPGSPATNDDVLASIDSDGTTAEFVIADISADDAWLTIRADQAMSLPSWR